MIVGRAGVIVLGTWVAWLAGLSSCSSFEAAPPVDATAPDASGGDLDGSNLPEVGDAAPCNLPKLPAERSFGDGGFIENSGFSLTGAAKNENGVLTLTTENGSAAGAVFWSEQFYFDALNVQFGLRLDGSAPHADGLAFVWLKATDVPTVGGNSRSLGVPQRSGFAVVLDTFADGEPAADPLIDTPFFSVVRTVERAPAWFIKPVKAPILFNDWYTIEVAISAGDVAIKVEGDLLMTTTIPDYVAFRGYWGLTAATGGHATAHRIRNLTVTIPPGKGCLR